MSSGRSNRIVTLPRKAQTAPTYLPRRVCAEESCATVLSIYNPADHCSVHEVPRPRSGSVLRR